MSPKSIGSDNSRLSPRPSRASFSVRALLAPLCLAPCIALAQPLEAGTYDVYFEALTREGVLDGCSLVFTALVYDTAYLQGAPVLVNGSFAVRSINGLDLALTGKLGTRQAAGSAQWVAPAHFYFASSNGGTTAGQSQFVEAETPGYKLLIANALLDPTLKILDGMSQTGEFVVAFNRKPGGQDVHVPIRMNVSLRKDQNGNATRTLNKEIGDAFFKCVSDLAGTVSRTLRVK
jgi:hypothetical protein